MDRLQSDLIKTVAEKYTRRLKRALGIAERLRKEYEEIQQKARLLQEKSMKHTVNGQMPKQKH
jgi:hypothetical protein